MRKDLPAIRRFTNLTSLAMVTAIVCGGTAFAKNLPAICETLSIDFGQLAVLQDLPDGKWRQVTTSSSAGRNSLGDPDARLADIDETYCASAAEVQASLIGQLPRECPVSIQRDLRGEARVTVTCPSQSVLGTTIPGFEIPVKITRPTGAQDRVVEAREQNGKFIKSTLTYLGDCDPDLE
jgi:hypothetical protein